MMLSRIREWLVIALFVLLPFHAFFVTVGTRLLAGVGQAPLPWLAIWKEVLLGFVLLIAVIEIFWGCKRMYQYTRVLVYPFVDLLDWFILGLVILGLAIPSSNFIFGFKYTLFPLLLFLVLRRVPWSEHFLLRTTHYALLTGAVVAGYGILSLFLPHEFFVWLGYSDLHSLYLPDAPLAAFQQIGGTALRRVQSTLSGPNQLGMWLLIPWSVVICYLCCQFPSPGGGGLGRGGKRNVLRWFSILIGTDPLPLIPSRREGIYLVLLTLLTTAILLTFSRAAWVGAAVIVFVGLLLNEEKHYSRRWLAPEWRVVAGLVLCSFGIALWLFPRTLLRSESSLEHLRRPLVAVQTILEHPLGLGLGSAGPASNRISDSCVYLEAGADASWAKDRPNLCVFVGEIQVQPVSRSCRCPLLPENWYLQVGVELGILGLFLFVALTVLLLWHLLKTKNYQLKTEPLLTTNYSLLTFIGISVAALFLHAWEDSAVAYTVWILIAAALPVHSVLRSAVSAHRGRH